LAGKYHLYGEEFQSYKGVTHWKFIKQVKDDYIFGKMVKIIDNWKDNYNDNMKEVEKIEDIFKYTPENRKQKVSNALKKVKQWMSLMNHINNDYNKLSTAIVLITNEVDVTEQDVLDICTELYYKCKSENFNTVLSEAVFISEFSKMKIDQLKEAKEESSEKSKDTNSEYENLLECKVFLIDFAQKHTFEYQFSEAEKLVDEYLKSNS
jgi:hypothetical protein